MLVEDPVFKRGYSMLVVAQRPPARREIPFLAGMLKLETWNLKLDVGCSILGVGCS